VFIRVNPWLSLRKHAVPPKLLAKTASFHIIPLMSNTATLQLEQQETMVMDQATRATRVTSAARAEKQPIDPEFEELIANYRAILHNRSIPYPIAYQFIKELGHGRQGVVFLGIRHGARGCLTHHAIKLFDPSIYSNASRYWTDMGRIAKQVSLLQPINNSNLVSRDFYEECNGIGYMQMQAIDGVDLDFLLDPKQFELARQRSTTKEWARFSHVLFHVEEDRISLQPGAVLYIMRNVLRGLSVLHENGFIHGDIKPTNIMIDVEGTVKLVDFGRAARIGEKVNILLGSPLYMAPEVHRREPGFIQSDIFSTGLLGLELLRGRQITAYADLNENALMDFKNTLVRNLEIFLPKSILRNIELTNVLRRFLEPEIINRYADAREAESGGQSLMSARQWMSDFEREAEYERELEDYLKKLVDPETGALNPHFASDNLTAVIIT
jgi:serine/threonine protein kinase